MIVHDTTSGPYLYGRHTIDWTLMAVAYVTMGLVFWLGRR